MKNNYTIYHLHTMLSNPTTTMDSVNSYKQYLDKAKELGMTAICFSEHGNLFEWYHKKNLTEKMGIKYIHGVEAYITESLDEKIRDNYHVVLIAKNTKGFKELNYLMSDKAAYNRQDGHFYYQPRISYNELKNTSDNIIITTACLGGILSKGNDLLKEDFIKFLTKNKHRCFLEIQHHNVSQQAIYNQQLDDISQRYNIPLITGTDTHSLNDNYASARAVLQRSKNTYFENEEGWDLTFKTYDELVESFKNQNAIPQNRYLEAIENTNILANLVGKYEIDKSIKYPRLWGDSKRIFMDKIKSGYIHRGINKRNKLEQRKYIDRIKEEVKVYEKTDSIDYMLFMKDVVDYGHKNNMWQGYGRGSVNGSIIAYLLEITDMDSIKFNLNFFRFMNPHRVSLCDIDTDWSNEDRDNIKEFLFNYKGIQASEIITFNTIAMKGAIRDVGRALDFSLELTDEISKGIETKEKEYRNLYPELFKYVDLLIGVVISIGTHPSGVLISPISVEDNVGTCTISNCNNPVSILNMKELDGLNYVKFDILGLDNVEIINKTCQIVGINRITPENIDLGDENVWKSIRDDTTLIFQWESDSAQAYIRRLFSDETLKRIKFQNPNITYLDLFSFGNGAIRPSGSSFRQDASEGIFNDNGLKELNDFLGETLSYLAYQEQIMMFLTEFCGYSMAESDSVRRAIGKKLGTEDLLPEIKQRFIDTTIKKYNIPKQKAEEIVEPFIQIILDASSYGFSVNHSQPYSCIGYVCGWLRYYYPLEFLTVALNVNRDNLEKTAKIKEYIERYTDLKIKPISFGKSIAKYTFDKKENCVYKGIDSIKYLNSQVAQELYELSQQKEYTDFINLLQDIKEKTSTNSRQLRILTGLNFFRQFGKNKRLLEIIDIYDNLASRKQINFKDIDKLNINEELLKKYSSKTTATLYKELNMDSYIRETIKNIEDKPLSIKEQVEFEMTYLEYCEYINKKAGDNFYVVIGFTTYKDKTKPYLVLRQINSGKEIKTKIKEGKKFIENPFKLYDVLKVTEFKQQYKTKCIGGEWRKTDELEDILYKYEVY